jgi:urea transport system permease protein
MRTLVILFALVMALAVPRAATAQDHPLTVILAEHGDAIIAGSRRGIGPAIAALADSGLPEAATFLERWQNREVLVREADGAFFYGTGTDAGYALTDPATGADAGTAPRDAMSELRPNGGIRAEIAAALVQFLLIDADPAKRLAAIDSIARDANETHLAVLRETMGQEPDPALAARKARLERLLTIRFDGNEAARVAAIEGFVGDTGLDFRAVLNPILSTTRAAYAGTVPEGANVARVLEVGDDLTEAEAWDLMVTLGAVAPRISPEDRRQALIDNIVDGRVGGMDVATLDTEAAREAAYEALEAAGLVAPAATTAEVRDALGAHVFAEVYRERSAAVTDAAERALAALQVRLGAMQAADLALDAVSLASIYFLAAIGLAITFGVMGVINMAHGEFIMMGAYTGYVVQLFVPDYTIAILIALPLAFVITFGAGVAMERLVIRWLYHRPLETLLATFGISIALQQLAKNIFGTQARPLTAPDWLGGALVFNDVVSISYIRVAIFVLALIFLFLLLYILKRTRLGLEVRAVTQNPRMAASMGINPDRINMLTFGLGSGIAGIAGVAIGLFAQVTSEIGQQYIVQSFMTVVVGGVGNIWGTLAGAGMIGSLQKGIEWLNPSNTLAAQTFMILFIILFIQFRPKGIIALKGRAAGD